MKDFNYYVPTRVVFGRESEAKLPELIRQYGGTKVLIHYGGGSARRYGLLDRVEQMLHEAGIDFVELEGWGEKQGANTVYDLNGRRTTNGQLRKGINIVIDADGRTHKVLVR